MKNHDYCPDSDEAAQLRKEKDDLAFELGQADAQLAAIRTRVAELDERANRYEGWLREVAVQRDELKQRNAELEAALQAAENYLRPYAEIHDLPEARRIAERIAHILASSESVTPAKHCEDCAPEFGCWDGGEPCYKQPLVKSTPVKHPDTARLNWLEANRAQVNYTTGAEPHLAHVSTPKTYGESCETIRARNAELEEALRLIQSGETEALPEDIAEDALARAESVTPATVKDSLTVEPKQEPCGGRCGDPECDLDTNGVTMRTPAPHADTVALEKIRAVAGSLLVWFESAGTTQEAVSEHNTAIYSIHAALKEARHD